MYAFQLCMSLCPFSLFLSSASQYLLVTFVNQFESVIRYVGGMLSAYELNGGKDDVLLQQTRILTEKLICAWEGKNDLPYVVVDFETYTPLRWPVSP